MNGAKYVINSANTKISGSHKIDSTYLSTNSCPSSCPLRNGQCYAKLGNVGIHVSRLNKESENKSQIQLAKAEAYVIDHSYDGKLIPEGRNLRIHVSGDSRTLSGSYIINSAIGRWKNRGGNIAYSYTHCWDIVLREVWSNVEMLASVDSIDQVKYARQNGYAPAIVVAEHLSSKAYQLKNCRTKWIPCQAQVRDIGCVDCGICLNTEILYKQNYGVAFAAHGVRKNDIKKRLNVLK